MSFRGRGDSSGNQNKMDIGESRKFGGPDSDKSNRDDSDRFDSGRGRPGRPPFGRGGRPSPGRDKPFSDRSRDYGYGRDEPMMRDRSPLRGPDDRFSDRFRKDESFSKRDDHGRKEPGRPYYGDEPPRDRFMDNRSRHEGGSGSYGSSRFDAPPPSKMPFPPRPMNYPNSGNKGSYHNEGFPKPNECEIIVVNKQQRAYAESVEDRVKGLGILVDILFLKDEALLTQTIDDIARRGSLYAMVISPQNETHGSVTVNILHGTPQEHRNMPLEDALKLLSRNFHDHIRSQKEHMDRERAERGQYIGVVADREIQFLLRMLADGRWISLSEINVVIRYLSERRDKMQLPGGDDRGHNRMPMPPADVKMEPPFKPKDDVDVSQKEQDLQNRIINLMNQGAPPSAGASGQGLGLNPGLPDMDMPPPRQNQPPVSPNLSGMRPPTGVGSSLKSGRPGLDENIPGPQGLNNAQNKDPANKPVFSSVPSSTLPTDPTATATYINFDNPSVQKALDNLMQSGPNLLKNISLSASGVTNTSSNQSSIPVIGDTSGITAPSDPLLQRANMGARGSDMGGNLPPRNASNLDMGPRGHMGDIGGVGGPRGSGNMPGMGVMGPGRGGYGSNMPDMGHMNNPRGFGGSGMSDMGRMGPPRGGMGPPQGQDLGLPQGMGQGNFGNQNQYNKFQGPGQQGNFPGPYNSGPGMGGMARQNYGGPQGMGNMGSGPRRY